MILISSVGGLQGGRGGSKSFNLENTYFLRQVFRPENNISGFILSRRRTDETNNHIIKKRSVSCNERNRFSIQSLGSIYLNMEVGPCQGAMPLVIYMIYVSIKLTCCEYFKPDLASQY